VDGCRAGSILSDVAPTWNWILVANVFLGISQGLTWSTTVIMKIDLVGSQRRGFAMGLNEFAGYGALAGAALLTGWIAAGQAATRPVLSGCRVRGNWPHALRVSRARNPRSCDIRGRRFRNAGSTPMSA
jgi:MFS family permease